MEKTEAVTICAPRPVITIIASDGSQDLIELVADYIAEKIEIDHPDEHEKCKRSDC